MQPAHTSAQVWFVVFALDLRACQLKTGAVSADHFKWQQHLLGLKDHQGNTALHLAAIEGLSETVQLLLQAGADTSTLGENATLVPFCKLLYRVHCIRLMSSLLCMCCYMQT